MSELKKHDITITYEDTYRPHIESTFTPREMARRLFYDWWDYKLGREPKVLSIEVDGEIYYTLEDTK